MLLLTKAVFAIMVGFLFSVVLGLSFEQSKEYVINMVSKYN